MPRTTSGRAQLGLPHFELIAHRASGNPVKRCGKLARRPDDFCFSEIASGLSQRIGAAVSPADESRRPSSRTREEMRKGADDPVFRRQRRLNREAAAYWILRRSLSSGAHSRDPEAEDDSGVCGALFPRHSGARTARAMARDCAPENPLAAEQVLKWIPGLRQGAHPGMTCGESRREQRLPQS